MNATNELETIGIYNDFMQLRGSLYYLLAQAFYLEPTMEYIENLKMHSKVLVELAKQYHSLNMEVAAEALLNLKSDEEALLSEAKEFTKLFLGVNMANKLDINPTESVYLSDSGLVMQEQWEEVIEIYSQYGMGRKEGYIELEDHISTEMMFMGYLAQNSTTQDDANTEGLDMIDSAENKFIKTQIQFLKDHLERWVPNLCKDIVAQSTSEYFKNIAIITDEFIMNDRAFIEG